MPKQTLKISPLSTPSHTRVQLRQSAAKLCRLFLLSQQEGIDNTELLSRNRYEAACLLAGWLLLLLPKEKSTSQDWLCDEEEMFLIYMTLDGPPCNLIEGKKLAREWVRRDGRFHALHGDCWGFWLMRNKESLVVSRTNSFWKLFLLYLWRFLSNFAYHRINHHLGIRFAIKANSTTLRKQNKSCMSVDLQRTAFWVHK